MAKISLDRLKERYPGAVEGGTYRELMGEIIANNHENISRAVARLQSQHFEKHVARIKRSTTKQVALPSLEDVLPKRSVFLRKGAEQGQMITDTLRDALTKNLRAAVADYLKTGAGSMQYRRGESRGRMRPELVTQLRDAMKSTFSDYTKGAVPANIDTIAQTEIRSAVSDIKHTYNMRLQEQNPGRIQIIKIWRHHPSLSVKPRTEHRIMDGEESLIHIPFIVPDLRTGI